MIEGVNAVAGQTAAGTVSGLSSLGSDAFLKLLVAQLRYQNPLQPTDPSAMLGQTAQFTTVETLQAISEMQRELMSLQESVGAMGMIGKTVTAELTDGTLISGTVDKVSFGEDGAVLMVGGTEVPLDMVTEAKGGSGES